MNRLTKKCLIASGVLHGTLALTLLFVSGFATSVSQPRTSGEITILPSPIEAPATQSPVSLGKAVEPVTKPSVELPRSATATRTPFRLVPTTRNPIPPTTPSSNEGPDTQKRFENVIGAIRASSRVDLGFASHESGSPSSQESFEQALQRVYFNNWQQPSDAASDEAVVKVTVTVASDGTVMFARITKSSGDAAVDRSVERLLKDVTHIAPFPSGSKESQRTYPLSFSLKAKRSLG